MRVLLWHVHGSWTTAFVQGEHSCVLPVLPDRGPDGRGRARTWQWPASCVEMSPAQLRETDVDVVIAQRPSELELAESWLGRRPGRDIPFVYLEHNTPPGFDTVHPMADRRDCVVVHVTHFNKLFWNSGSTRTCVIEHGIPDPGARYTGAIPRAAVVANEPLRRRRAVGTDLLKRFTDDIDIDLFGMGTAGVADELGIESNRLHSYGDVVQDSLYDELAQRRVYLHLTRWTSLGLSLIEAMHLGMPIVALATTETPCAVPPEAGVVSTNVDALAEATRMFVVDEDHARSVGDNARQSALNRYGLSRFLADWDRLLKEVTS